MTDEVADDVSHGPAVDGATVGPAADDGAIQRGGDPSPPSRSGPGFAHASEAEMARILDFYGVAWQYEPHTFPILWNLDGDVVESFSPDFYLPEFDIYLELTTLRQRLVRKKNRKLRRIRELYPDLRIKLFYARDFRALMLKYGKLALVDALSGTPGQVVPVRPMAPALAANPLPPEPLPAEPPTEGRPPGAPREGTAPAIEPVAARGVRAPRRGTPPGTRRRREVRP